MDTIDINLQRIYSSLSKRLNIRETTLMSPQSILPKEKPNEISVNESLGAIPIHDPISKPLSPNEIPKLRPAKVILGAISNQEPISEAVRMAPITPSKMTLGQRIWRKIFSVFRV